jgi:hypothetical protein
MREGRAGVAALIAAAALSLTPNREPRTERVLPPPPANAALRAAVEGECVVVELPGGGTLRVWPARRIRAAAPRAPDESPFLRERVEYAIEPGSLVAVASWDSLWRDYKDQAIPAGVYSLVYAVQPAIKEHRGVSEFRDVLLAVPLSEGAPPGRRDLPQAVAASLRASGTSHPAVLALFPAGSAGRPARITNGPRDTLVLEFRAGKVAIGLAVSGKGRLD